MASSNKKLSGYYLIRYGNDKNGEIEKILLPIGELKVGRDETSDLRINSVFCSRIHCSLQVTRDKVVVEDKVSVIIINQNNFIFLVMCFFFLFGSNSKIFYAVPFRNIYKSHQMQKWNTRSSRKWINWFWLLRTFRNEND